jgi:hypothetical protein
MSHRRGYLSPCASQLGDTHVCAYWQSDYRINEMTCSRDVNAFTGLSGLPTSDMGLILPHPFIVCFTMDTPAPLLWYQHGCQQEFSYYPYICLKVLAICDHSGSLVNTQQKKHSRWQSKAILTIEATGPHYRRQFLGQGDTVTGTKAVLSMEGLTELSQDSF